MDPDTIIIVAALPIYGIVCVGVAKLTQLLFTPVTSQAVQADATGTPGGK